MPRVAKYPPYVVSAADEVIEFAALFGLHLDPWQQFVLTHGLGQTLDGEWTATRVGTWVPRQNGKGAIIEALELSWLFMPFAESDNLLIHSAHEYRTADNGYDRIQGLIEEEPTGIYLDQVKRFYKDNNKHRIELLNGRQLQFRTRTRTGVRGFSAPKVILDEAQELTVAHMAAIGPTVSAQDNWQMWFFGTPPTDPTAWCYGLKADGEAGSARLAWFDWGIDTVDLNRPSVRAKVYDLATAYQCNPAMGIRITEETVLDEQRPSGLASAYPVERCGMWPPQLLAGRSAIPRERWEALRVDPERPTEVAFAAVVGYSRTVSSIAAVGLRPDGLLQASIVDHRQGTNWLPARLAELREEYDPIGLAVQDKGPTGALMTDFDQVGLKPPVDRAEPSRGDLALAWAADVASGFGMIVDAVRDGTLVHVDDEVLNVAVAETQPRPQGGAMAWDHRSDTASPLIAVTLALWCYRTWSDLVASDYDPLANIF